MALHALPFLMMAQNFHLKKQASIKNPQADAIVERIHQVMSDSI
jgi:hypothetical protein